MLGSVTDKDQQTGKLIQWAATFRAQDDAQMVYLIHRGLANSRDVSGPIQTFCRRQMVYPGTPADHERITADLEEQLAGQQDDQYSLARADTLLALVEIRMLSDNPGDIKQARQYFTDAVKICEAVNDGHRVTEIHIVAAKLALADGKLSDAVMHLEQAARFATTFPPTGAFGKTVAALLASAQAPNQLATTAT